MNSEVELLLARNGKIGEEDAEKAVKEIIASIPEVELSMPENAGLSEDDLVLKYGPRYFEAKSTAVTPSAQVSAPKAQVAEYSIPASASKKLIQLRTATAEQRHAKQLGTHMTRLLADKPYPGDYLADAPKLKPSSDITKFEKFRDQLVQDKANVANYEACLQAIRNNEPMEIYIPDREKWNPKVMGFEATVPTDNAGATAESVRIFSTHSGIAFLALEINGMIPCGAGELGVTLGKCKVKTDKAKAEGATPTPRLVYYGRKAALQDPKRHTFISQVKKNGNDVVKKEGSVRSELSFKIITGHKDDGTVKTRTVRVSGKTEVPVFERASALFADVFGDINTGDNGLQLPKGEKEKSKMEKNMQDTWFALANADHAYSDAMQEMMEKYQESTAGNPAADMGL